jgi:hypothetical protein
VRRVPRGARRADERDVRDGSEYFEFVCNTCHSILLTLQKLDTEAEEKKPHRQELNGFSGIHSLPAAAAASLPPRRFSEAPINQAGSLQSPL